MEYDVNDTTPGLAREHEALAWLRANDPVHWDARNEAWLLTRHAEVREVLHRSSIWSSARGFFVPRHMAGARASIMTMDDPEHARYRKLIARAFTPGRVKRQEATIRSLMDDAIDALAGRSECDLVESLAIPLPMRMIATLLGFDEADPQEFSRLSDTLLEFSGAAPGDQHLLERGVDAVAALSEHIRRAADARRARPREDLLSVLLQGVDAGILRRSDDPAEDDLFQFAMVLIVAGNETTRNTISWGMHALLENPRELQLLRASREKIALSVEECVRWASTLRGIKRTAVSDTELGETRIRAGEQAILLYPSVNRDEALFEAPFEFRAFRDPNPHMAFGEGSHFCLGANLARLEVRVALEQILDRLPGIALAPGAELVPKLTPLLNGVGRMDVVFDAVEPRAGAH